LAKILASSAVVKFKYDILITW